ncbi:hypothetical protein [Lysinibacillus parviboronicapiens]|uniref:hypothetical protein n=1 Tax=Lysinibacillus parviboronicapiens TaxID=436516 RepID=UPI000D3D75DE|nr:hypothetical protein [Lysinibacillus parviboronicapiens]
MEDRRYGTHMNWDRCKCQKMSSCCKKEEKCHCKKEEKCHCKKEEKCHCKKEEKCHSHKEDKCANRFANNCRSCICDQLRKLEAGTLVDIFLSGGGSFLGLTFISFSPQNCCAYFLEAGTTTSPLIIDCKKIDALRRLS